MTGYYSKGTLIMDIFSIIKKNLRGKFWLDCWIGFSILTSYLIDNEYLYILSLIIVVKIIEIQKLWEKFKDNFQLGIKFPVIIGIMEIIFMVIFFAHLSACSIHYTSLKIINSGSTNSWLLPFLDNAWYLRYLNCIYFSIVTQVTVGYGDISPKHPYEKLLCLL